MESARVGMKEHGTQNLKCVQNDGLLCCIKYARQVTAYPGQVLLIVEFPSSYAS